VEEPKNLDRERRERKRKQNDNNYKRTSFSFTAARPHPISSFYLLQTVAALEPHC